MAATEPISGLEQAVAAIWRTVSGLGYRGALVGGLGVSVRAEPRFTRDVDVAMAAAGDSDLRALIRVASLADLERARSALRLIRERGFHRNRDLECDLLALLP